MRIAELEQRTGVSRHTLRYYEKQGLLVEVDRRDNNYRDYPEQAVQRITLLRQLKSLGFSLKEIREVLDALRQDRIDCAHGAALMARKRETVERRMAELAELRDMLAREQQKLEESAERVPGGRSQTKSNKPE